MEQNFLWHFHVPPVDSCGSGWGAHLWLRAGHFARHCLFTGEPEKLVRGINWRQDPLYCDCVFIYQPCELINVHPSLCRPIETQHADDKLTNYLLTPQPPPPISRAINYPQITSSQTRGLTSPTCTAALSLSCSPTHWGFHIIHNTAAVTDVFKAPLVTLCCVNSGFL